VSVRKRVIKIFRDICTSQPDFEKIPEMCIKMIARIGDEESIRVSVICLKFGVKNLKGLGVRLSLSDYISSFEICLRLFALDWVNAEPVTSQLQVRCFATSRH